MSPEINISGRKIGRNHKPFIIAEVSANHNGSYEKGLEIIQAAAKAGACAIKLQTYTPDTMTLDCEEEDFFIRGGLWDGRKLYDLYREAHTPWDWHKGYFEYAKKLGVIIFSTPFDETAVDFLESINCPAYKVASFELTDTPLLKKIASTKKPVIMSTGLANLNEIKEAVAVLNENGCTELAVLHCVSAYPAEAKDYNLLTIPNLEKELGVTVGLSDHTLGIATSVASVALGASIIEKHFTISRLEKGPDSEFSLEPKELAELCMNSKIAWEALGSADYSLKSGEVSNKKFRRSIYVSEDIEENEILTPKNIKIVRPSFGLEPKYITDVLGKRATKKLPKGTALKWELIR